MSHWMQVKTLSQSQGPCARWGHAMCSVGDNLYLFGGYESSKYFNDLWKFNLHTLKFSQVEQLGQIPPPCSNFTMNINEDQSKIILFGGGTSNKEKLNSVYQLDIASNTWKKLVSNADEPRPWNRSYHCSEIIENYLVVFGGEFFHDLDDLWLFDLENCVWTEAKMAHNEIKPKARKFASSFQYNNRFYLIGGCYSKYQSLPDAFYLDFTKFLQTKQFVDLTWVELTKLNKNEGINRWGHVSVVKGDKAYIFGGRQGHKDLQTLVSIDLLTQKCSNVSLDGELPKGRRKPGLCLRKNTLFCHSGFDGSYVKDFFQINLLGKPKYSINQANFEKLDCQNLQTIYDNNVKKLLNTQERLELRSKLPSFAAPLSKKQFALFIDQSKVLKANKYFQFLMNGPFHEQQFKIYIPQGVTPIQQVLLTEVFLLYLQYGKVFFSQQSTEYNNNLTENLLELADYYCIFELQSVLKAWLIANFQRNIQSKKGEFKKLVEISYVLKKYDLQMGQYTGYNALMKLIKVLNITKIDQLKLKLNNRTHIKQVGWLLELLDKFQFQLQQSALHKSKAQSQNDIPELNEWNGNEKASAAPSKCFNFFGIF